jgi:hypothetical protein
LSCSLIPLESSLCKPRSSTTEGSHNRDDGSREDREGARGDLRGDPNSYEVFANDAFALQERALGFARELLENPEDSEASASRATLEELAENSRDERQRFEILVGKASEAYLRVLRGPVDEHHHKIEEAEADLKEAGSS